MNKKLLLSVFILLSFVFKNNLQAQLVEYSENFTNGTTYCPGSSQYDNWGTFRANLDTSSKKFLCVTASGTFNTTGVTCNDPSIVRRLAQNLRNGTAYNASCNGLVWTVGNAGSCTANSCGSSSNQVELTVNTTSVLCNCGALVSFNPIITNANWGTVYGGNCSPPSQRMTLQFFGPTKNNDIMPVRITPLNVCTPTQNIAVTVRNIGKNNVDSFRIELTINGVAQPTTYLKRRLFTGCGVADSTYIVRANYAFTNDTRYNIFAKTSFPNGGTDSAQTNDSTRFIFDFFGPPAPPSTTNVKQCGNGRSIITATPTSARDSIVWYDAASGGSIIGYGKSILAPYITSTKTFYAEAYKLAAKATFSTSFGGGISVTGAANTYNGAYFNVTPSSNLTLDSVMVKLLQNAAMNYRLYYKTGTFVGSETNSGAWTLAASGSSLRLTISGQNRAKCFAGNLQLIAGQTYGFYITTDGGNDLQFPANTNGGSNGDLSYVGGKVCQGLFGSGGVYQTYGLDALLYYRKTCSNSSRTGLTVTVKPRPIGADVVPGTPFQGQVKVGAQSQPDLIEIAKTLTYDILPPSGYNNSDYNITWTINSIIAKSKFNVTIPNTEYTVVDPGTNNGTITYIGKSAHLDSNITFYINIADLGPHFCDSTIARTLRVVPTPKTNFEFPNPVCDGDAILFENKTTIHSGNATYKWYFGDGDSSDLVNPVKVYATYGIYPVRLVATSFPYNVVKDTTINVEVTEVPQVAFKAINACEGTNVRFINQTTIGSGILVHSWDFGDGSPLSAATNPTKLYTNPGGYKVTLTVSANGCSNSLTKNAYQFAKPVANFTAPAAPICAKSEVVLPNTSTIQLGLFGSYWTFGDGNNSTLDEGNNKYANAGTYSVNLKAVSEFGCENDITKPVTIKPTPSSDFTTDQLCSRKPTNFNNTTVETVSGPAYSWTISDGSSFSTKNITKSWPNEGPYDVTLKTKFTNGCEDEITKTVNITIQPKADFTVANICSGEMADFVNLSKGDRGGIVYNWDFGNGTGTDAAPRRLYNPPSTNTYNVKLVASYPGACSDTIIKPLTVSQSPLCDFDVKNLGFLKYSYTPTNTSYTNYEWFFGEGGTSVNTTPNYQYLYSGNFKVTMTATNSAGCKCSITKLVGANTSVDNVSSNPQLNIYPNPNNGSFTIKSNSNSGMKIEVYNLLGSKVLSTNTIENNTVINLGDNAKGIYLVKVTINGVTTTTKVTVMN